VLQLNMTRRCLSCLFFKKFKKVPKTRAMQDLCIPSWHNFLELVKHQAGNSSVFAGHITKCENLLGGVYPQERCITFWNILHCFFFPVFPSYSTGICQVSQDKFKIQNFLPMSLTWGKSLEARVSDTCIPQVHLRGAYFWNVTLPYRKFQEKFHNM
jgi:hypothetical protein